jgi:hypothetical protein
MPQQMTRRLFVGLEKIQIDQSLGALVQCMMTELQFVGIMRAHHQKNLSPEEREETRTRHMRVWRV